MRTVIFTSSCLRHKAFGRMALSSDFINVQKVFIEKDNSLISMMEYKGSDFQKDHLDGRSQSEEDTFGLFLSNTDNLFKYEQEVEKNWFSSQDCLEALNKIKPDLILVYGTSIIRGEIINIYRNRILNLHLGLTPYYRGSGTNLFPILNDEPEFIGATYMYLDEGIDTGEIIHQIRPKIIATDSFHQFSNRFLIKAFKTYIKIAGNYNQLENIKDNFFNNGNSKRYVYKNRDFTDEVIKTLYEKIKCGLLKEYLMDKDKRDEKVQIFSQKFL